MGMSTLQIGYGETLFPDNFGTLQTLHAFPSWEWDVVIKSTTNGTR